MTCKNCIHDGYCWEQKELMTPPECNEEQPCCVDKSRYIELPCKVGDNGYLVTKYGIVPVTFDKIILGGANEMKVRARYFVKETVYFDFEHFGKTVFLTREEAEKALKEREGK